MNTNYIYVTDLLLCMLHGVSVNDIQKDRSNFTRFMLMTSSIYKKYPFARSTLRLNGLKETLTV